MAISLVVTNLNSAETEIFRSSLSKESFKTISDTIFLVYHTDDDDDLAKRLSEDLQQPASLAVLTLHGNICGVGPAALSEQILRSIFSTR